MLIECWQQVHHGRFRTVGVQFRSCDCLCFTQNENLFHGWPNRFSFLSLWGFPRMSERSPCWLIYGPGNEPGANSGRGFCVPSQSSVSVLRIEVWHILMFNYDALWGPPNEQQELYWTQNKEHQLQVTVLISAAIANRLTDNEQQLGLVNLNMHNPNICIRNRQLSSEGISHALAFEIGTWYTLPATFI